MTQLTRLVNRCRCCNHHCQFFVSACHVWCVTIDMCLISIQINYSLHILNMIIISNWLKPATFWQQTIRESIRLMEAQTNIKFENTCRTCYKSYISNWNNHELYNWLPSTYFLQCHTQPTSCSENLYTCIYYRVFCLITSLVLQTMGGITLKLSMLM